jgi:hypothetical protein
MKRYVGSLFVCVFLAANLAQANSDLAEIPLPEDDNEIAIALHKNQISESDTVSVQLVASLLSKDKRSQESNDGMEVRLIRVRKN